MSEEKTGNTAMGTNRGSQRAGKIIDKAAHSPKPTSTTGEKGSSSSTGSGGQTGGEKANEK